MFKPRSNGFTLAELLISLAILAVIAVFTIPKILASQQNQSSLAAAKEVASTFSAAYYNYFLKNGVSANTSIGSVTPYVNYVAVDSVSSIDLWQTQSIRACNGFYTCLKMHSGGMVMYANAETFGGTNPPNAVYFIFDPDGKVTDGTTNGPGKSVLFFLYPNNILRTAGSALPNTVYGGGSMVAADPAQDPPYFSW